MNGFDDLRKLIGGLSGDPDKVESSDWGLTGLGIALLAFTAFRTWDWLTQSLPDEWKILGIVGLAAFDVGTLVWAHVYLNKAVTDKQRLIAKVMFFVDLGGVALTSLGDASFRSQVKFLPEDLTALVSWIVPVIIIMNIAAYYLYKFNSPEAAHSLTQRQRAVGIAKTQQDYEAGKKELGALEGLGRLQMDLQAKIQALAAALQNKSAIDDAANANANRLLGDFAHQHGVPQNNHAPQSARADVPASEEPLTPSALMTMLEQLGMTEAARSIREQQAARQRAAAEPVQASSNGAGGDAKKYPPV